MDSGGIRSGVSVLGLASYHPGMVDVGDAAQATEARSKSGKGPLIVSVLVALLATATSTGLYLAEKNQAQNERESVRQENKIQAYKLFIAQARLTGYALQDVLECQEVIDGQERKAPEVKRNGTGNGTEELPKSVGSDVPDSAGVSVCNGLKPDKHYSLPEMKAAKERLEATWLDEYKKLAEPHADMVKYANLDVTAEVEILYRALGSLTGYDDMRVGETLAEIEGDFCGEVSPEC